MAGAVSDEDFAIAINQMGAATLEQIEAARAAQAAAATNPRLQPGGAALSLAEVLVQQGIIPPALRDNVEKKVLAQHHGGIKQLGCYRILRRLGEGGMGAVYLAEDTHVQRKVALKVLGRKYAGDAAFLSRFRREAQATGKLNHVNIVGAYMVGEDLGHHYYAMEYCEGETLGAILKRERVLPWDRALEIVAQVARGLQHAHDHGFIHRDIKPANVIIVADGVAKILDLGLSKNIVEGGESFTTQTGVALGTPHYLAPEQAKSAKHLDGRVDIYSLGATLYHLVTGCTPFQGETGASIMLKHLSEQARDPQDIREDIPDAVVQLIHKMMAKDPAGRYQDCAALLADIELVLAGRMPAAAALAAGKSSVAPPALGRPDTPVSPPADRRGKARKPAAHGGRERGLPTGVSGLPVGGTLLSRGGAAQSARTRYLAIGVAGLGVLILLVALLLGGPSRTDHSGRAEKEKPGAGPAAQPPPEKPAGPPSGALKPPDQPRVDAKPQPAPNGASEPRASASGPATPLRTEPAVVKPPLAADARPWRPIFDGRTLDCLAMQGEGAWRLEDGAITKAPGKDSAAQSAAEFADGEIRFRFEAAGTDFLRFCVRQGGAGEFSADLSKAGALAGKVHELVFRCRGLDISATLDGQPVAVAAAGRSAKGHLQFNAVGGKFRLLAIEYRELAAVGRVANPPDAAGPPDATPPEPAAQKPDAGAGGARLEYEKLLADVYALLNKGSTKVALALLEQARADPQLAAMRPALALDMQCARLVDDVRAAALAGTARLADKRPFRFAMADGKELATGQGTKNVCVGTKDGACVIEQDLGGGQATIRLKPEQLSSRTLYELARLGLPADADSDLKLAFVGVLALASGPEDIPAKQVLAHVEAARKGKDAALADHIAGRLTVQERERDADGALAKIDALVKAKKWEDVLRAVAEFKRDYRGTRALKRLSAELDKRWALADGELHPLKPGLWASFFAGDNREPVRSRVETKLNQNYGAGSPDPAVPNDAFGVRCGGILRVEREGRYPFQVGGDDYIALYIDGKLLAEAGVLGWAKSVTGGALPYLNAEGQAVLTKGDHDIRVEYREALGNAQFFVRWRPDGAADWQDLPVEVLWHDPRKVQTYQELPKLK